MREDKDEIWLNKFLQNCPVPVTRSQVENFITSLELESYPNSIICRGHDVLTLSSQMMIDTTTYSEERIFKKIAREYSQEDFDATALGTQIHSFLMSC